MRYHAILIAQAVLIVSCGLIAITTIHTNAGHLVYALDDPYIEMAMAKNIVLHGVYGVTQYETTAASSSIIWPWILAGCYLLIGVNEYASYILNLASSAALLVLAGIILQRAGRRAPIFGLDTVGLVLLVVAIPLPTLCQIGMEHVAHCLAMLALFYCGARLLSSPDDSTELLRTALLAAAATSLRYEGAFLVIAICAGLALLGRVRSLMVIALCGALPILIYGLVALAHGQYFFPNSVLVKTIGKEDTGIAGHILAILAIDPELFVVGLSVICLTVCLAQRRSLYGWVWNYLLLYSTVFLMHIVSINAYNFYRYQAYLIAAGIVGIFSFGCRYLQMESHRPVKPALIAVTAVILILSLDPVNIIQTTEAASTDIYRQQYLDAKFVKTYYDHDTVVLNDIGAVAFFTDAHLVDFVGLASKRYAALQINHQWNAANYIDNVNSCRPALGIVYLMWMPGMDRNWIVAANRTVVPEIVCADHNLAYLAFQPSKAAPLAANVATFFGRTDPYSLKGSTFRTGLKQSHTTKT